MYINILTLFPSYFDSILKSSILQRAVEGKSIKVSLINIRDFSSDFHKRADDRPYGGGPGMVLSIDPIYKALQSLGKQGVKDSENGKILLTSAKGELFTQNTAKNYYKLDFLTVICGHYEGVDERVVLHLIDHEVRIGDYVLTGGEPAAAVMIDAVARLLPGVLGNDKSNQDESHSRPGLLGFPQYTRPSDYNGWKVPEVLQSGHHEEIEKWRDLQRTIDDNK